MPRRSPFGPTTPAIVAALVYAGAAIVWVVRGQTLPGGRWLAVHLFTLGVVTNVVLAFSEHFSRTLTHAPEQPIRWQVPVVNVGIVLVLFGLPSGERWATATGALGVAAVVVASYARLRQMRKAALGARFAWIVRTYERAHGAFIHGALLGLLMGVGALKGSWYVSARVAHLHVNILGWSGLTLLATLVFFGPTMARTRIVDGADDRAARALRSGATGLTIAVLLLVATGVGSWAATPLRVSAAVALALYARAVAVVCVPVAQAAWGAKPSAERWPVVALSMWFPVIAWVDVVVIATGSWRWLDALGLAMLLGVLAQSITAVLTHLAPMLLPGNRSSQIARRARIATGAAVRTVLFNAGALAVVLAAVTRTGAGHSLARAGWGAVMASVCWLLIAAIAPIAKREIEAASPG